MADLLVPIRGGKLWSRVLGNGPPLVFCHGGPGLWDAAADLEPLLTDRVTLVRWDQRGCGRSSPIGPYTLNQAISDIETLIAELGYDKVIVGGHSWGARLAFAYAAAIPERVRGYLSVAGTGLARSWKLAYERERALRLGAAQDRKREALARKPDRTPREELQFRVLSWAPDFGTTDMARKLAEEIAAAPYAINFDANEQLTAEIDNQSEEELLVHARRMDFPALIINGLNDPRPATSTESLADALPECERILMADVGHWPWLEDPTTFARVVRRWLQRFD